MTKSGIFHALLIGGLALSPALVIPQTAAAFQYYPDYGRLRGLVDRTQTDLRASAELEPSGQKQHERYRDAQKALSDLDRHLAKGKFDHGEVDRCVDHIKSILDHNTLQATSRDALMHDIEDFRVSRASYDH